MDKNKRNHFESPLNLGIFMSIVYFLESVLTADHLTGKKVLIAIISALITPPDFVSQLIVLIPMALLYEASIHIVLYAERRNVVAN